MNNNLLIHTPEGFRDTYGTDLQSKRILMDKLRDVFTGYSYREIQTPVVEFFDVFGSDVGTTPSNELFKFFDRNGYTLVLRPDFTPSVARAVAMHFTKDDFPLKLFYEGSTFVNSQEYQLNLKESTQMGVELIGDGSASADAEVLLLTCDLLKKAGLTEFQVSVGENDYFKALAEDSGLDEERIEEVRRMISNKNFFGVDNMLDSDETPADIREAFVHLPQLFGGKEVLDRAEQYAANEGAQKAVSRLQEIEKEISGSGNEKYISFDFSLLSKYHYYTGVIFSAFTYGTGEPVAKGGRYDRLLGHFGTDAPAVGVGVYIDQLRNALIRQGILH